MEHAPLIRSARAAVRRSAAVRRDLRGRSSANRGDRLRGCLGDLTAAAAPIGVVLKSGPLTGRTIRNRELRAMSAEIQAERARVRGMLRRASGGAAKPRVPYRRAQFRSSLIDIARRADEAENDLRHVLPQYKPGTREYRDDAERILRNVDSLQRRLTTRRAQARHWARAGAWGTKPKAADRRMADRAVQTSRRLTKLRAQAKRAVAVPIRVTIPSSLPQTPRTPRAPVKRRRWTAQDAWVALVVWTAENGRAPRAADLPGDQALPSYAKLHALFEGLPSAADLADDVKWYQREGVAGIAEQ